MIIYLLTSPWTAIDLHPQAHGLVVEGIGNDPDPPCHEPMLQQVLAGLVGVLVSFDGLRRKKIFFYILTYIYLKSS